MDGWSLIAIVSIHIEIDSCVSVDWEEFTSTTEHNLSLLFFNPNKDIPVHASVVLWGDI